MNSIYYLLAADILLATTGQLLLKKGMAEIGALDFAVKNIPVLIVMAIKNIYIWMALIGYGLGFVLWLFVLSKVKLSLVYPSASLVYVLVILGSWLFFKEAMGPYQIAGSALILVGLLFLFQATP